MVTNFEEITQELTNREKELSPLIIEEIKKYNKPVKSNQLVSIINHKIGFTNCKLRKITDNRLRKFINYYRKNGVIPVCSTSDGYFVSYDKQVLELQVKSLNERASSIREASKGLEKFIN